MPQLQQIQLPTTPSPLHHERRETGAHAIIAQLLLADLVGIMIVLFLGATIGMPLWWLLQWIGLLYQGSLVIDIAVILILTFLIMGLIRHHLLDINPTDAWVAPTLIIVLIITLSLIWKLADPGLFTIAGPAFPLFRPTLFPLKLEFSALGTEIAAALVLLAHLQVWWRYRATGPRNQQRSYSSIHAGGSLWALLEHAFKFYHEGLARFQPRPIEQLKTPLTVQYYEPTSSIENPELAIFWVGHALVLPSPLLGPHPEQADILLPLVARALYDYNSLQLLVDELLALGRCMKQGWLTRLILCLPLLMASSCKKQWDGLYRDQVLDRDRFAYWCGEGKRLHAFLWKRLQRLRESGKRDTSIPTLSERIDHLDSLMRQEARQVVALRATLPTSPGISSFLPPESKKEE